MTEALQTRSAVHRDMCRLTGALARWSRGLEAPLSQTDIELLGLVLGYVEQYLERTHQSDKRAHFYRAVRLRAAGAAGLIDQIERDQAARPALLRQLREELGGLETADGPGFAAFCTTLEAYAKRLQEDVAREEALFPIAREALLESDCSQICAAFRLDGCAGAGTAARAQSSAP